jgi:tetratricopeptide (TPR) repeat protein
MEALMFRRIGPIAFGIWLLASPATLPAKDQPAALADIVCLACTEKGLVDKHQYPQPLLARELIRQAFLIAARDECGLSTRDATLREEFPSAAGAQAVQFDFSCYVDIDKEDYCYELGRASEKSPDQPWKWRYHVKGCSATFKHPNTITILTEQAEALSRGTFKELLGRQGANKAPRAIRTSAALPEKAWVELWSPNEIAVIGGLRRIHSEIRDHGESPELIAGLAVGYANLGMLTENYFSAAPKAFSARGLLYAERLLQKTNRSPWALWHRAYVLAIAGLHRGAKLDLEEAKKLEGKSADTRPLPFWTHVVDNFLQGKLHRMVEKAADEPQRRLAKYLDLEAAMCAEDNYLRVKTGGSVVKECPDCFRALDGMCSMHYIGPTRAVTSIAFERTSASLRRRLPEIPGVPDGITTRIRDHKTGDPADEINFRVQLVDELKQASRSGQDKTEPSLAVLGQTVEEVQFLQVLRRLSLERFVWAVPTEETIAVFRPLCERHPYGAFVDVFSKSNVEVIKGVVTLIPKILPAELTVVHGELFTMVRGSEMLQNYGRPQIDRWMQVIYCHGDPVLRDELLGIEQGAASNARYNGSYMAMLAATSKTFPAAVATQIRRNWKETEPRAEFLERTYADDPVVQSALRDRYLQLKKYEDAERCGKQKLSIAPDFVSYRRLAEVYKANKQMALWKATLEKSLELPDLGLEGTTVQTMLALYHMDRWEWETALPYAKAAAESGAGWAMQTSARCHEMLGQWTKAEALMRAISERYESDAFDWMVWCYRTGHGDKAAATDLARKHFESLGTAPTPGELEAIGMYYLFRREPDKALPVFEKMFERARYVYDAMQCAMTADLLGKADLRDKYLEKALQIGRRKGPKAPDGTYFRVAKLMKAAVPPGTIKDFDFKELDGALDDARNASNRCDTNLAYFVAIFLKNRGEVEKSRHYLVRCAQTAQYQWRNQALACDLLREMKVPFTPLGDEKPQTN